ncbi:hypothetical protein [Streptococcus macacae]|uniref:Uncharacterized protein n=1 Tax=Streptococcus macacae NCTC 11558 TaxID=764298 RepID=G5JXV7_9STRE|nr:hypothetical protein [Streptococcus macacae]EHJ52977.1 hypothetical protein STRMA_0002 [Streptococcus macacae NCTC 11558]SUN77879.1 lipoprotein [Streptococcus macacae NCTC 11558]
MKRSTKITLISLTTLAILAGIGAAVMVMSDLNSRYQALGKERLEQEIKEAEKKKREEERATKEKQVAYLKEHEQEMTGYVKSQNPEITTVKFDWDSIRVVTAGNGTPQGGSKVLLIFGYANGSKLTNIKLKFAVDKENIPKIDSITSDNLNDI